MGRTLLMLFAALFVYAPQAFAVYETLAKGSYRLLIGSCPKVESTEAGVCTSGCEQDPKASSEISETLYFTGLATERAKALECNIDQIKPILAAPEKFDTLAQDYSDKIELALQELHSAGEQFRAMQGRGAITSERRQELQKTRARAAAILESLMLAHVPSIGELLKETLGDHGRAFAKPEFNAADKAKFKNKLQKALVAGQKELADDIKVLRAGHWDRAVKESLAQDTDLIESYRQKNKNFEKSLEPIACEVNMRFGQGAQMRDMGLLGGAIAIGGVTAGAFKFGAATLSTLTAVRGAVAVGNISIRASGVIRAVAIGSEAAIQAVLADVSRSCQDQAKLKAKGAYQTCDKALLDNLYHENCLLNVALTALGTKAVTEGTAMILSRWARTRAAVRQAERVAEVVHDGLAPRGIISSPAAREAVNEIPTPPPRWAEAAPPPVSSPQSVQRAQAMQRISDAETQKEFPNLFLPENLRSETSRQIPSRASEMKAALTKSRQATEGALSTIFDRVVIPLRKAGSQDPEPVRFFEMANKIAREVDPTAKVVPSGGVVRSALGMIYEEMLRGVEAGKSAEAVLAEIKAGKTKMFNSKGDLMAFDLRGVGSDFDLLVQGSTAEKRREISKRIHALFANPKFSAEQKAADTSDFNKAYFTIADVKDLNSQIRRSTQQGGASLDLLYYDLKSGRLVEPEGHAGIVNDFLRGEYRYLPPATGVTREDPASTTMRGARSLVELPFLRIKPRDQERLNDELRKMLRDINFGKYPDEKAIKQILKLQRNARLSQGNNRIERAPSNTTLGLLRSIAEALERKRLEQLIKFPTEIRIHAYTPRHPLSAERVAKAQKLPAEVRQHLISSEEFLANNSADGFLFHGTSGDGALSILRGGFRQTEYEKGLRRGTYTSNQREVSAAYASRFDPGFLLRLPLRRDRPFLALSAADLRGKQALARLEAEAKANNMELSDWLSKQYGIDVVLEGDKTSSVVFIVKNTEIIEPVNLPMLAQETAQSIRKAMDDPNPNIIRLLSDVKIMEEGRPMFKAMGVDVGELPTMDAVYKKAESMLPNVTNPKDVLNIYALLPAGAQEKARSLKYGGRSFSESYAAAMADDSELVMEIVRNGYGADTKGLKYARQTPEWKAAFENSMKQLAAKIADPKTPPSENVHRLLGLTRLIKELPEDVVKSGPALLNAIPRSVFDKIVEAAKKDPKSFEWLRDVEENLNLKLVNKVNLTGPLLDLRLERLKTANNMNDKLTQAELVSWNNHDFMWDPIATHPRLFTEIEKLLPEINKPEDFLHQGTISILRPYESKPELVNDKVLGLLDRALTFVVQKAPTRNALEANREVGWLFNPVFRLAIEPGRPLPPELVRKVQDAITRYDLEKEWPGYANLFEQFRAKYPATP
jgi:hypothetical protein